MKILHMLNVADFFFMAMGVAAATMMMIAGDHSGRRKNQERVEADRRRAR